jgi:hypothetical protein
VASPAPASPAPAPCAREWRSLLIGAALAIVAFGLYLPFRSPALDDWDSVQFAMGLEHYDMASYRPHFPGYPVYIGVLRVWRWVLTAIGQHPSSETVLITWSVLAGAATVFALFWVGTLAFGEQAGVLGAALAMLHPLFWLEAEKALTGTTGTLFFALVLAAALASLRHRQAPWLVLAAALSGLYLGVRHVDAVLASPALFYALYAARRRHGLLLLSAAVFVAAVAAWMVPQIVSVDGWARYEALFERTSRYVLNNDSILAGRPWSERTALLRDYLFGEWAWITCVLGAVGLVALLTSAARKASSEAGWLIVVPTLLLSVFYGLIGEPRAQYYFLPTIIGLSLLAGYGLMAVLRVVQRIPPSKTVGGLVGLLMIVTILSPLLLNGADLAGSLHRSPAPLAQAARYASSQFSDRKIVIITANYRHFEYYLPSGARVLIPGGDGPWIAGRVTLSAVVTWAGTQGGVDDEPVVLITGDALGAVDFPTESLMTFTRDLRLHRMEGPVTLYRAMDGVGALANRP